MTAYITMLRLDRADNLAGKIIYDLLDLLQDSGKIMIAPILRI